MSATPILTTDNLTMRFGGVLAVDQVNFSLDEGELRCLIGPNGAGKSTFFKCLSGQLKPTSGTIRFNNQPVEGLQTHEMVRRGIGIKTQVPNLFDGLSAAENVMLSALRLKKQKAAAAIAEEMFQLMDIGDLAAKTVSSLAHGQRQLVELAMVLAGEPTLVLLDEPAAGMAGDERARLADVVRDLSGRTTLIVVEHDMDFIKDIADIVTVFHRGRVFLEGKVDEIMSHTEIQEIYLGREGDGTS